MQEAIINQQEDITAEKIKSIILSKEMMNVFNAALKSMVKQTFREEIPEEFNNEVMKRLYYPTLVSKLENLSFDLSDIKKDTICLKANVDNLNDRMDNLSGKFDNLSDRVDKIEKNMVTKEDAKNFATKDDLKDLATKDDLKDFATKDDLNSMTERILTAIAKKI